MAEYIEREALLKKMLGLHTIPVYIGHVTDEDKMFETMVDVVEEQPTADVVEVVRCKDCKNYEYMSSNNQYFCNTFGGYVTENDYCGRCERRDFDG